MIICFFVFLSIKPGKLNFAKAFVKLYTPVGSIWQAPNGIWETGFAQNKNKGNFHPAIIEKIRPDNVTLQLAPGTSKSYNLGSCVFKAKLKKSKKTSYFLLKLSIPYFIDDVLKLKRGWDKTSKLDQTQIEELKMQIKFCKG